MSVSSYYTGLINSSEALIEKKQSENENYAQQETNERENLNASKEEYHRYKREHQSFLDRINCFLRENGGLFNLNDDQKNYYLGLLKEKNSLANNIFSLKKTNYGLTQSITALSNRQYNNYSTIFDATLDISDYKNQQALFSKLSNHSSIS